MSRHRASAPDTRVLGDARRRSRRRRAHAPDRQRRALESSRRRQEPDYQAKALHVLSGIATRYEPPDLSEADARYHQALALADELGMRLLQARCHLGLGKLYRRVGRMDDQPGSSALPRVPEFQAGDRCHVVLGLRK